MFNMSEYKARVNTKAYNNPAWELLERCVEEMNARGIEPGYINSVFVPQCYDSYKGIDSIEIGGKYIAIDTVYRSNGTAQDVSVSVEVFQKDGNHSARRIFKIKVPKDASAKVIGRRIDKVVEELNA